MNEFCWQTFSKFTLQLKSSTLKFKFWRCINSTAISSHLTPFVAPGSMLHSKAHKVKFVSTWLKSCCCCCCRCSCLAYVFSHFYGKIEERKYCLIFCTKTHTLTHKPTCARLMVACFFLHSTTGGTYQKLRWVRQTLLIFRVVVVVVMVKVL